MTRIQTIHVHRFISRFGTAVAALTLSACAPSSVTVGDLVGASDASAAGDTALASPCAAAPYPAIGCASGPTELVCDAAASPPRWSVMCPGDPGTPPDSGAVPNPCASAPVPSIGCTSGSPLLACDTSLSPPAWSVTCPGQPGRRADAGTPCDGLGFIAIACASGPGTYTCDTSSGAPQWRLDCSQSCCPQGLVLSAAGCIWPCAPGQLCSQLVVPPTCDAGLPEAGVPSDGGGDAAECCPTGWNMFPCTFVDGGAGLACHNSALGCVSSFTCGGGCDSIVSGRCGP